MSDRHGEVAGADMVVTRLPDGRALTVRAATAADVDGLVALYAGLGDEDSHRRFFSVFRPDRAFFERMVEAGAHGGDQLVVTVIPAGAQGAERIVGEAGYRRLANGDAELAMAIASSWRGWLGAYLFEILRKRAAARGIPNLRADVLVTNRPMVAVLGRDAARADDGDLSVVRLVVGTSGPTATWPERGSRPRLLVEVPGGRWRATPAARAAGFDVMACCGPRGEPLRCPALHGEPCPLATGADAVVVRGRDDGVWEALLAAHRTVHADVPVVIDAGGDDEALVAALLEIVGPPTSCRSDTPLGIVG